MAKNEIYRVEIPIIVDDQSDAPLRRAEERVSRFQRTAEKRTKMVQGHMERLARMKVEPTMGVRDKLTSKVLRADRLLERLGMKKISPLIDARDRVTWKAREIGGELRRLTSRGWEVTIRAKDKVTGAVKSIANKLTSPLALLGVGGGVAGVTGMGLGMVMEEQDLVSSFEVMLGSRHAAEKRMQELITFAGQTPFTRQEIWRSSRQLELMTKGALATGEGLRLVGDVAAGTVQPFEDVAMWIGRLYDGMASGRPIGEAASRLQEMGAISGEARAKLEKLADSGRHISETWPQAAKEFERFNGLIEKQSKNLRNIMLGTKTFFTENVIKKWGLGVADMLQPALMRFRVWRSENKEAVKQLGDAVERYGRRVGGFLVGHAEKAIKRVADVISDPKFKHATFSEKVRMLVSAAMDDTITWLEGPGKDKMVVAFTTLGETAAKAYIAGMKALGSKSIEELKEGNIKGAAIPAGLMYLLGGGAIARGAWGLWKRLYPAGKGAMTGLDKFMATRAASRAAMLEATNPLAAQILRGTYASAASTTATTAAQTTQAASRAAQTTQAVRAAQTNATTKSIATVDRLVKPLGNVVRRVALPLAVGLEAYNVYKSDDKIKAATQGATGLISATAGAKLGAALGTVLLPGIGTIIGGFLGAGGGYIAGRFLGGKAVDVVRGPSVAEAAQQRIEGAEMQHYLNQEVYEPFREHVNRAESWGRNLIGNFMRGRDSAGMSMGGWLNTRVYEPFRSMVNRATSWGRNLMGNFNSGMRSVPISVPVVPTLPGITMGGIPLKKYAIGGILSRPHMGMVAEAGPEAIIPLSAGMRGRALALYEEAGRRLGVRSYAEGGLTGNIPIVAPSGDSGTVLSLNLDMAGMVGQIVINNQSDINGAIDKITGAVAVNLRKVFQNMPK